VVNATRYCALLSSSAITNVVESIAAPWSFDRIVSLMAIAP